MEFGLQFFPDVSPDEKSAQQYWNESLDLTSLCDDLGYTHVRTVEHYFEPYGGYSPAPSYLSNRRVPAHQQGQVNNRGAGAGVQPSPQSGR